MEFVKNLFLSNPSGLSVQVDQDNHTYRSPVAKDGFVETPLFPKLNKPQCTIDRVWNDTVEKNSQKPIFGNRNLIKVNNDPCHFIVILKPFFFIDSY